MIKTEIYDEQKGVKIYTLGNNKGMTASFIERGATITSINVPDKNGKIENVVLSLKNYDEWVKNQSYINVVPGRFANRIGGAKFTLDGKEYKLNPNDGPNSLHGGPEGFHSKNWTVKELKDSDEPEITFEYFSKDGEENFPGNLTASITYKVTKDNELSMHYQAVTDKATPVNLTQHAYFNLSGDFKNTSIADYAIMINANAITEVHDDCIPTGVLMPVEGTDFDFRKFRRLKTIKDFYYDHNFVLNSKNGDIILAAEVEDPESGRILKVFTNYPGMQFYTGNWLDSTLESKYGKKISRQSACCFETQFFPDSPNKSQFPKAILSPGKSYNQKTIFKFEVETESDKDFFPEV
ncbi:MAG: galactose mutarotase [Bacteroidales bacterium]|jgi:aldose 1-epimerase|nr:galactose mutarotase [Bacteroidales bacterium]